MTEADVIAALEIAAAVDWVELTCDDVCQQVYERERASNRASRASRAAASDVDGYRPGTAVEFFFKGDRS